MNIPSTQRATFILGYQGASAGGSYYVDNTLFIETLAHQETYYVRSRLRRFDKSLLLATPISIKAVAVKATIKKPSPFSGNKPLYCSAG